MLGIVGFKAPSQYHNQILDMYSDTIELHMVSTVELDRHKTAKLPSWFSDPFMVTSLWESRE